MPSFYKTYPHRLDGKKRFSFPAKWKKQMKDVEEDTLYILPTAYKDARTGTPLPCLELMRQETLDEKIDEIRQRIKAMPEGMERDAIEQGLQIQMGSIEDLSWDGNGRTRISDELMAHADIDDEVVLVGKGTGIVAWGRTNFDTYHQSEIPLPIRLG